MWWQNHFKISPTSQVFGRFCLFGQNWHKIWKSPRKNLVYNIHTWFQMTSTLTTMWPWWARQGISCYHSTSCSYILGWRRYMLSVMKEVQNIYSNIFLRSTQTGVLKLDSDLLYVILLYIVYEQVHWNLDCWFIMFLTFLHCMWTLWTGVWKMVSTSYCFTLHTCAEFVSGRHVSYFLHPVNKCTITGFKLTTMFLTFLTHLHSMGTGF